MNTPVFLLQQQVSRGTPPGGYTVSYSSGSGLISFVILLVSLGAGWGAAALFDLSGGQTVGVFCGVYLALTLIWVAVFVHLVASEMERNHRDYERYAVADKSGISSQ